MSDADGPARGPKGRFARGHTGNPKGRPRGSARQPTPSAFDIVVAQKLTVTRNGQREEVGVEEALQHKTYQDAIAGNRMARRAVLKMVLAREKVLAKFASKMPMRAPIRRIVGSPDNANEALRLLEIVSDDPKDYEPNDEYDRIKLNTWAIQAALARRRGGKALTDKDIAKIRRCSLEPDQIRWPRRSRS